jgi:hypothetical protein
MNTKINWHANVKPKDAFAIILGIVGVIAMFILLNDIKICIIITLSSLIIGLMLLILAKYSKPRLNLKEHVAKIRKLEKNFGHPDYYNGLIWTLLKEIENNNYF